MVKYTLLSSCCLILLLFGCAEGPREIPEEIRDIPVSLEVHRFDREFAQAGPEALPALKEKYPYLFPAQFPDSIWTQKMQDSLHRELLQQIDSVFPDLESELPGLELLVQHVLHYYPQTTVPQVITVPTEVDYRNRVILADSLLFLGLDNYLGPEHRYYGGIDRYIARELDRKYLLADIAAAFAQVVVPRPAERTFLARMLYYGKLQYLKERLLPLEAPYIVLQYSPEEWEWAQANEEQIWRYFITRELLYSTEADLGPRFLNPAPFSKFRLELDNESPGRLGQYIGWQIVRAYMERNDVPLQEMLRMPANQLFQASGYKPKK